MKNFLLFVEQADSYIRLNKHSRSERRMFSFVSWIGVAGIISNFILIGKIDYVEEYNFLVRLLALIGTVMITFVFIVDLCKIVRYFILLFRSSDKEDFTMQRYVGRRVRFSAFFKSQRRDKFDNNIGKTLTIKTINQRGECTIEIDGKPESVPVVYQLHVDLILNEDW